MSGADSFHARADAFETAFERSYSAFQLHCRGVRALRQSLPRHQEQQQCSGSADPDPDVSSGADVGGSESAAASSKRDWEGLAETHLLRTLGAQLAELVTTRECEKMVRRYTLLARPWFPFWKAPAYILQSTLRSLNLMYSMRVPFFIA